MVRTGNETEKDSRKEKAFVDSSHKCIILMNKNALQFHHNCRKMLKRYDPSR